MAFACAVATFYFTFWMGGALLSAVSLPFWTALPLAGFAAFIAARFIWRRAGSERSGLAVSILQGALILGTIGFIAGFFGPIVFAPDANQGPLLGIFYTGPLGLVLGAVAGAVHWFVRGRRPAGPKRRNQRRDVEHS